jgi:hypothetical protein
MSIALFLLLLSVPLGVLLTMGPAWVLGDGAGERIALPTPGTPSVSTEEPGRPADSSHHPATCLAVAAHRAGAYLGYISARWHLEDLDPMTWLIAGRLRDRFETAMLAAIGAVNDWLGQSQRSEPDPRMPLERERIHETLAQLISSLPTFSVSASAGSVTIACRICSGSPSSCRRSWRAWSGTVRRRSILRSCHFGSVHERAGGRLRSVGDKSAGPQEKGSEGRLPRRVW